ncbi:hypothetical protein LTR91_007088 [Friedmanniomyces endolithicus]|uniref:Long-chain-alcohol oxidase n=1 Tax=Friedmanniomyces endolithicus TaxID=329885 RepID=A0AAN6KQ94_9PEZI|nr:hypothetical protein LTR35_008069 [Friedmanniomyces endolithicus]KAK0282221.1 hypothetical protein LTS00_012336 [Friedmanniomyces endolithicus]KAK0312915.1 hypothetical protein LTR01_002578 [Friedmanniomyces endolithicus]KAK0320469.1 hypothetical protein LTR82_008584 [Friedmanniomyces endolithicus]KAK0828970.1 hypothetical protein LTR73_004603 [Friedmanniomyces endolithicus]
MPEVATYQIRQAPSPLPPGPSSDVLTAEHWGILSAIADTVIPSFAQFAGNRLLQHPLRGEIYRASCKRLEHGIGLPDGNVLATSYLAESAFTQKEFKDGLTRLINVQLHEEARKQLIFILNALGSRAGSLLLTGYTTPLDCLPIQTREEILHGWTKARLPLLRQLHRSLTTLVKVLWVRTSPTLGLMLNYPRTPVHQNAPGTSYPFTFVQIPPSTDNVPEVLEADVVVVGSGCGSAVAAKTFAEAGMKVIVVDKSYYWPPEHLPMSEHEGFAHLFANGGALQSDDSSMAIVAGSAWGGGGTVNWSASLQTQGFVRREWSNKFGLSHFTSAAYQADLDAVCDRMGVGTAAIEHNKTNQTLLDGARKLGWNAKAVPQNTGGKAHNCGYCTLGCGSSGKQGPAETFLPDAGRAGATFIEGFDVQEVMFENGTAAGEKRTAGVRGIWTSRDSSGGMAGTDRSSRQLIIKAPKVVVSCGSIYTPVLLRRSGLTNPHIGRHLHMHPVCLVGAVWDEDTMPWEGSILTTVINEFENLDGEGYGVKLEAICMLPGFFLPLFPWRSGLEYKEFAAKMKRMTGYISLARDRYGGRVYPDPVDCSRARIQYTPSKYDKAHILEGMVHLAELLYVEGAREIFTSVPSTPSFVRPFADPEAKVLVTGIHAPSINDAEFQAWVGKLRRAGLPSPDTGFASAHQMGSCRMGTSADNSAVDPNGRVWGTQGLYVCDASVFPSASGVNPMVTNMAISRGIARRIVEREGISVSTAARARL